MAETNILVTDRHEWAGFRGGKEGGGKEGGREGERDVSFPSFLPPFLFGNTFCSSGGLRYG